MDIKRLKKEDIDTKDIFEMPARSRILFAQDGLEKIRSIDQTIEIYGKYTARELVDLTHRKSTPWEMSGKGQHRDEVIEKIL